MDMLEKEVFNTKALKRISKEIKKHSETDNVNNRNDIAKLELKELEEKKRQVELCMISAEAIATDVNIDADLILSEYEGAKATPGLPVYQDFVTKFIDKIEVGKYTVNISLKTGLNVFNELNTTYTVRRQEVYESSKK